MKRGAGSTPALIDNILSHALARVVNRVMRRDGPQLRDNLLNCPRSKIVAINTDVKAATEAGESRVAVSVDVAVTLVTSLPHATSEVVRRDVHLVAVENLRPTSFVLTVDEVQLRREVVSILLDRLIVVPEHERVPTVQLVDVVHHFVESQVVPQPITDVNRENAATVRNFIVVVRDD